MTNHPITPPPELVQQWRKEAPRFRDGGIAREEWLMHRAAQWGADQELDACCKIICNSATNFSATALLEVQRRSDNLRAARRPKQPSLKEQAHDAYWVLRYGHGGDINETQKWNTIRRALEALPND